MPDPDRLLQSYSQSAATLNLLRAFSQGGYASLNNVHRWMLGFIERSSQGEKYQTLADQITKSLEFMKACGLSPDTTPLLQQTEFYTSHEALLLGMKKR